MQTVLYKVTKSARLSEQRGGRASPSGSTSGRPGLGAHWAWRWRHADTKRDTMYTFTGLGKDQGRREDVEMGPWGHGNSCTMVTGKKKGTRTRTPNHADKTRPVQHSKAEGAPTRQEMRPPPPGARQEAQSPSHAPRAPVGDIAPPPGASNRYSLLLTPRGPAGGAISPRPQHSGPVRAAGSGMPFSAPLLLGAQGRQPSPTAPGREEEPTRPEC